MKGNQETNVDPCFPFATVVAAFATKSNGRDSCLQLSTAAQKIRTAMQ
jgi:hypothetical protein